MALSAKEAVARIPGWANASRLRISSLGGGITNQNFRVDVNGKSFALRIPGESTELLGINREHEYEANSFAGNWASRLKQFTSSSRKAASLPDLSQDIRSRPKKCDSQNRFAKSPHFFAIFIPCQICLGLFPHSALSKIIRKLPANTKLRSRMALTT